ncbi:NHL repeat-containing protein [Pseudochryseolinea flava]|nr:hypothetical protein [Pseudochryseolinea flava]
MKTTGLPVSKRLALSLLILLLISSCCRKSLYVSTYAGNGTSGNTNGVGSAASFAQPIDVAADKKGNVYVAEKGNNAIRKIAPNKTVTLFYDWARRPGAGFVAIRNLDADSNGKLFVIDDDNLSIQTIEGGICSTLTGKRRDDEYYYNYISVDGSPDSASFFYLLDLTVNGSEDFLFAIDRIRTSPTIRQITMSGFVTTPSAYSEAFGSCITMDAKNNMYLSRGSKVVKVSPTGTVTDLAGSNTPGYADGVGAAAQFNNISSIDADAKGNVYVSDNGNHRIRKISVEGVVTTLAGNGTAGFVDGPGGTAQFNDIRGIVVYKCAVYVADLGNNRIRRISIPKS